MSASSESSESRSTPAFLRKAAADVEVLDFPEGEVLARSHSLRRRKRTTTAVRAGAGMTVIVAAGIFVPGWLGTFDRPVTPSAELGSQQPSGFASAGVVPQPPTPDRPITVAAMDIPEAVQSIIPGNLGTIVQDDKHSIVDSDSERIIYFMFDGGLTLVNIQPAPDVGKTCEEFNDPSPDRSRCVASDGLETVIWPPSGPSGPRSAGVMVWQHGYEISAYVFADDGTSPTKAGEGLDTSGLIELASSEVWFE